MSDRQGSWGTSPIKQFTEMEAQAACMEHGVTACNACQSKDAVQARLEEWCAWVETHPGTGPSYGPSAQQVRTLLARVAELEAMNDPLPLTALRLLVANLERESDQLDHLGQGYIRERNAARQQLAAAQERIAALEGAIRLIRDQARPVMVGDAYLSATAEVPVAAVEAAASLLPDQPGREG